MFWSQLQIVMIMISSKKVTWNIGQLATQNEMYTEAVALFQICLENTPVDNLEERLLASFFKCQAVYHDSNHNYAEMDLHDLEKSQRLSEEVFPKSRSKKSGPHIHDKQRLQQLLCIFEVKCLVNLFRWDDLRKIIERVPARTPFL